MPCTTFFFNGKNYPKPTPTIIQKPNWYIRKKNNQTIFLLHIFISQIKVPSNIINFIFIFFFSNQVPPISAILKLCHKNPIFIT